MTLAERKEPPAMRECAICHQPIFLPDYLIVGDEWLCRGCKEAVAYALLDEDRYYWDGVRRDRRRYRRVNPRRMVA